MFVTVRKHLQISNPDLSNNRSVTAETAGSKRWEGSYAVFRPFRLPRDMLLENDIPEPTLEPALDSAREGGMSSITGMQIWLSSPVRMFGVAGLSI